MLELAQIKFIDFGGYIVGMKLFRDDPYVKHQLAVIKKIQKQKRISISASASAINDVYYKIGTYCLGMECDDKGFNETVRIIKEKLAC